MQHIIERRAALFGGALGQPHEVFRFQTPRRRGKDPGAGDIIEWSCDQPQVRQDIPHQRMLENRQLGNDEGDFPAR